MSEKLDGVRCYWDGKKLYTRNGKPFYPPDFWINSLPKDICLDGELWTGRNDFQNTVSIVRRQDKNDEWEKVQYKVFDAPKLNMTFSERYNKLKEVINEKEYPYVKLVEHKICESKDMLFEELELITKELGEGVMIRDPNSYYE